MFKEFASKISILGRDSSRAFVHSLIHSGAVLGSGDVMGSKTDKTPARGGGDGRGEMLNNKTINVLWMMLEAVNRTSLGDNERGTMASDKQAK